MSPGSGADTIGRIVAGGMSPALGQQVVIDNRTGAAGNIGAELAAKSPADGYTVFQASMTHAVNVTLYSNLPYDLVRDFARGDAGRHARRPWSSCIRRCR